MKSCARKNHFLFLYGWILLHTARDSIRACNFRDSRFTPTAHRYPLPSPKVPCGVNTKRTRPVRLVLADYLLFLHQTLYQNKEDHLVITRLALQNVEMALFYLYSWKTSVQVTCSASKVGNSSVIRFVLRFRGLTLCITNAPLKTCEVITRNTGPQNMQIQLPFSH